MKKIKCKVVHSQSKTAWNIVGEELGCKHKLARIPYTILPESEIISTQNKSEALKHAQFLCYCLNNADKIQPE